MLAGKLQQCEPGITNIIAFGNPLPMHDREVHNALLGGEYVANTEGNAALDRSPKAPFVPAQYLFSEEDRREFVDPFRKMSAVWHLRLRDHPKSESIPNPNAIVSVPAELLAMLCGDGKSI